MPDAMTDGFGTLNRVSLKALPDYSEDMVQEYIYAHPEVLGLGELEGIRREKPQQAGGRVDMILEDGNTWYEVEVQLGSTDPDHIIRTIEYWDNERWRYPKLDHVAVLIAEEVTGRFFNVISLFNKHIPIIAFQMTAFRTDDGQVLLTFSKVLDRVSEDVYDDAITPEYDLDYWIEKRGEDRMQDVRQIFTDLFGDGDEYRPRYTKNYIGARVGNRGRYYLVIFPYKQHITLRVFMTRTDECDALLSGFGEYKTSSYDLRVKSMNDYSKHRETIREIVRRAASEYGVELRSGVSCSET